MWFRDVEGEPATDALEKALRGIGVRGGHRIASLVGATPAAVALHRIALRLGLVVVPLDARRPDAAARIAASGAAVALVLDEDTRLAIPALRVDEWGNVLEAPPVCLARPTTTEAGALVWSSGTTGPARPVLVTSAMLAAHAAACRERIQDGPATRWLCALGLHHVAGLALIDRVVRNGSQLVLEPSFDAVRCAVLVEQGGITHMSLVPTQLRRLLAAWGQRPVPRRLVCVLLGGDAAPADLVATALAAGWPIHTTYGLTETCGQVATARPSEVAAKPGTVGQPLPGVSVSIRGGEIHVSGPTAAGGAVATGDLGRIDEQGFLYVMGRRDDRITTGGEKVDPTRVEAVLRAHATVADAAVIGVPDDEWGSRVVALVAPEGDCDPAVLAAYCRAHLAAHEVPKEFRRASALPRTDNGKLQRARIRDDWYTYGPMPT